jgi:hypothetical protein
MLLRTDQVLGLNAWCLPFNICAGYPKLRVATVHRVLLLHRNDGSILSEKRAEAPFACH